MAIDFRRHVVARWPAPVPADVELLREAAIDAVLLDAPDEAFGRLAAAASLQAEPASQFTFGPREGAVVETGLWPGISRGPNQRGRGDETASASREPWVDSNGYRVAYLRALYPERPAVLGFQPDVRAGVRADRLVSLDTLELALVEAWAAGGNYLLALTPEWREALRARQTRALEAWRRLGQTGRWLKQQASLFGLPANPVVTALVEPGAATAEIANLLVRRGASPRLEPATAPPAADPSRCIALVAAGIGPPAAAARARILAHAEAGGSVIAETAGAEPWWRDSRLKPVRTQQDRDFFALGRGQVVAYKKRIADPSEFALDVIDIVTHPKRAVRLWNAPAVIPLASLGPEAGRAVFIAVNYGSPADSEIQARIQGHYSRARMLRPEAATIDLKTAHRGSTTEVFLPELARVAAVVFS